MNQHKVTELAAIFSRDLPEWLFSSAAEFVGEERWTESGSTFVENARIKAQFVKQRSKGHFVLADDSGLVVNALGGRPGVWSSSYAGREGDHLANSQKLLEDMRGVGDRAAKFVCQLCLLDPEGNEHLFLGECPGVLIEKTRGAAGFGYDPLFIPHGFDQTFAEMGDQLKNQLSHRNQAFQHLRQTLLSWA